MTIEILGGPLTPVLHDGNAIDAVYGVDANGAYLGVVPVAAAAGVATRPPPQMGTWRWVGGEWTAYVSPEQQAMAIEAQRDDKIAAGVSWNSIQWYADPVFQQQIAAYLQAFTEGILPDGAICDIRSMDAAIHQLGRDDLRQLAGAVLAYVQGVYAWSWAQKALIGE